MPSRNQERGVRELLAVTRAVSSQFRAERIIAIIVVSISLLIGLCTAVVAILKQDFESAKSILFGTGGVCTVGVSALFYMYNRSLIFIERMAGGDKARQEDAQ